MSRYTLILLLCVVFMSCHVGDHKCSHDELQASVDVKVEPRPKSTLSKMRERMLTTLIWQDDF